MPQMRRANQKEIPIFCAAHFSYALGYSGLVSIVRERLDVRHHRFGNLYLTRSNRKMTNHLTKRCSQSLAVSMSSFHMTSIRTLQFTLAPASGG
jgi:hypothetical protein